MVGAWRVGGGQIFSPLAAPSVRTFSFTASEQYSTTSIYNRATLLTDKSDLGPKFLPPMNRLWAYIHVCPTSARAAARPARGEIYVG